MEGASRDRFNIPILKLAQYLSSITIHQDPWDEMTRSLVTFLGADLVCFGERRQDGTVFSHHWSVSDGDGGATAAEPMVAEAVEEVLESGFLTTRIVASPSRLSAAFLPIAHNARISAVLVIGRRLVEPPPRSVLDVYLGVAALVATTISRLESERELRRHRQHLEDLVAERTAALTDANRRLEREIAERRRAEEEARHLAYHDSLTGLPNRLLFNDHLELALAHARRTRTRVALMMLDLDEFKSVNDGYGHAAGDDLLRRVAGRLRTLTRQSDTVARIGGDEFALILPDVTDREAPVRVAEKLATGLQQAFIVDGVSVRVGASVGVSVYPDDGTDGDTLMRYADLDMYRSKGFGGSNTQGGPSSHRAG